MDTQDHRTSKQTLEENIEGLKRHMEHYTLALQMHAQIREFGASEAASAEQLKWVPATPLDNA